MTPWKLTDGTVVHLGGKVEGDSSLAALLRTAASRVTKGAPDLISVGPQPGSWERLDLSDAQLVNIWVRTAADKARVGIVSAPDVEPLAEEAERSNQTDSDDGTPVVY